MRSLTSVLALFLVTLLITGCEDHVVAPNAATQEESLTDAQIVASKNGLPTSATIVFGRETVGSPFPPPDGHDASTHAKDSMVPRTVVIAQGGSVTFEIGPFHRAAIYDSGTLPGDIDISATVDLVAPFPIPGFVIDDPTNRLAVAWADPTVLNVTETDWTYVFNTPGRYLVICTTVPHFVDNDMYGWVIVK